MVRYRSRFNIVLTLTTYAYAAYTQEGVAALVFDEFHERSLDADLSLALATDVRAALRPDLRLVVMSATLGDVGPAAAALLKVRSFFFFFLYSSKLYIISLKMFLTRVISRPPFTPSVTRRTTTPGYPLLCL